MSKSWTNCKTVTATKDTLLAIKYQDRKEVFFLNTLHKNANTVATNKIKRGELVRKPNIIDDYNKHMGGVDKNDQIINSYTTVRKSHK